MARLLTRTDVKQIRNKAEKASFYPALRKLQAQAADLMGIPVAVPERQAGYYHDYFCPEHGLQLVYESAAPKVHRCPHDGKLFCGEPFDSASDWLVNNRLSEGARRLALLWQLTQERRYLDTAVEILSQYARRYIGYPKAPNPPATRPGRVGWSCLDESVWAVAITWAYDLVRDALAEATARQLADGLLRPAAEVIIENMTRSIHNIACWNIAAIGTVGVALADEELIRYAIEGDYGLNQQLDKGVLDDGLWFEGSLSYHYYTLGGLMSLAQACRNSAWDIRDHSRLKSMFAGPIRCAYPDLSLPATNDCWYAISLLAECGHGIVSAAAFYEVAYSWYGDEVFAALLAAVYARSERDSAEALLFGAEALPQVEQLRLSSVSLEPSGYAILRSATDAADYLLLKYGPDGGGHGHPDKLSLIYYANGERMSPDLGTPGYGIDLNEAWYRQTVSHNTVTIDAMPQDQCAGALREFAVAPAGGFSVAGAKAAWSDGVYAGVSMGRTILWREGYFVDLFSVACDRARQIDWIYHNLGAFSSDPGILGQTTDSDSQIGYDCVDRVRRGSLCEEVTLSWKTAASRLDLVLLRPCGSELIAGVAPFNPAWIRAAMVIVRRTALKTTFVSVFLPSPIDVKPVRQVCWLDGDLTDEGYIRFVVGHEAGNELWDIRQTWARDAAPSPQVDADQVFRYDLAEGG